jgi:hypothetical protein
MPRFSVSKSIVPSFSKVDTTAEVDHFRKKFQKLWGLRISNSFPGCNPKSIGRHDLPGLIEDDYLVSLKSDGVRYALFLTMRPGKGGPIALLLDRTWAMYEVDVAAPEEFFTEGTILEGELVWKQPDERFLMYLVFDSVVIKGEKMVDQTFSERLDAATRCTRLSTELAIESSSMSTEDLDDRVLETDSIVLTHYRPNIVMRPKSFVDVRHTHRLWNERIDVDHRVDGLILNKKNSKYVVGTASNGSIFKWKPQSTIDLKSVDGKLFTLEGMLPDKIHAKQVIVLDSRVRATPNDDIVEYLITIEGDTLKLFPLRSRPDKNNANSERIVLATVQDVIDDVKIEDINKSD